MSISVTQTNNLFNNQKNLIIIFSTSNKALSNSNETEFLIKDNYVFIYENKTLIGINIFDYHKDFENIKKGYHNFSDNNFNKIVEKYPNEMKGAKNNKFLSIGLVKSMHEHDKNDKLKVLLIETEKSNLQIITNLSNLEVGKNYLFATNNAFLATGTTVYESKIMGIESQGMICSYKSIGIDREGIVEVEGRNIQEEFDF